MAEGRLIGGAMLIGKAWFAFACPRRAIRAVGKFCGAFFVGSANRLAMRVVAFVDGIIRAIFGGDAFNANAMIPAIRVANGGGGAIRILYTTENASPIDADFTEGAKMLLIAFGRRFLFFALRSFFGFQALFFDAYLHLILRDFNFQLEIAIFIRFTDACAIDAFSSIGAIGARPTMVITEIIQATLVRAAIFVGFAWGERTARRARFGASEELKSADKTHEKKRSDEFGHLPFPLHA